MKFLTACMMVKNEEELLKGCLDSLVGFIDELCIIDTGSTDSTVQIINDFMKEDNGIKVRFKEIPWGNDFSWMRNKSIAMAKTDWIFIIDADERIRFNNKSSPKKIIREMLNTIGIKPKVQSMACQLMDWSKDKCVMTCATARFFKNTVKYKGIIHNSPDIDGESILLHNCIIDHYGYDLSKEKMDAKFKRTHDSLMKQLGDDPDNPHTEFYLCQLFGTRELLDEALSWGEKYLNKHAIDGGFKSVLNPTIFYSLGRIYMDQDKLDKAMEMCEFGIKHNQEDPDLYMVKSDIHHKKAQLLKMACASKEYLTLSKKIKSGGITGKFYFSINDRTRNVMLQRIVTGSIGEGLNAVSSLYRLAGEEDDIFKHVSMQLDSWGIKDIAGIIHGHSK